MFEYQPRRHPLQTFQFWFAILVCAGGVAGWRSLKLPNQSEMAESSAVLEEEELPPPPLSATQTAKHRKLVTHRDTPIAPPQNEEESQTKRENQTLLGTVEASSPTKLSQDFVPTGQLDSDRETPPLHRTAMVDSDLLQLKAESRPAHDQLQTANLDVPEKESTASISQSAQSLDLAEIDTLIATGEDIVALRSLSTIYWQQPEVRSHIRSRLNDLSRRIYFSPQPHYMEPYEVQFGDRLETIAKRYEVPWEYLAKMNRIDAQRMQAGKKLKVIQGPFQVVIDLSDFEATVHAHGYFVVRMPVGIGKDGATPVGTFRVTDKVIDPIYYGPDGVIKNDDPANPLGERWIAISDPAKTLQGYGLHGTIDPNSIGKSESRGCVRLHDQDIADLYDLLGIGSEVVIRR